MKKWAIVTDEINKICTVGEGTDVELYKSMGMHWMDVEQAYNGLWYVKGYAPIKPQPTWKELRIKELKQKLLDTDYIHNVIAEGDATEEDYADVIANRKAWRAEVRRLEGEDNA